MKGVVMNMLADMVETQLGIAEWNSVLTDANVDGVYTATALYPDEELMLLVQTISTRNNISINDLVFAFGEFMFPQFYERYPALIDQADDLHSFLSTVHDVIHVEVKKLYPDAETPDFSHAQTDPKTLHLEYRSKRQLCQLAEGLISGAAKHFDTQYTLKHAPCMHEGADHCGLEVTISD